MNIKPYYLSVIFSGAFLLATPIWADQVTATFNTGETLDAAKLGDLVTQINDNDDEVSALQTHTGGLVSGCSEGTSIRAIAADGTVTCEVDDNTDTDTTYSAGTGISLVGTSFNNQSGAEIAFPSSSTIFSAGGSTAIKPVVSITVNIPSSGFVIVTHSGGSVFFGDGKTMEVGIGLSNTSFSTATIIGRQDGSSTNRFREQYTLQYMYSVTAGTKTFYGLARANTTFDKVQATIVPQSLSVIFLPNRI